MKLNLFRIWHPALGYTYPDKSRVIVFNPEFQSVNNGEVLEQFIGVVDKDGVKIYENDLVRVYRRDDSSKNKFKEINPKADIFLVKFDRGGFCLESKCECFQCRDDKYPNFEVIGNINQNPTLYE